MKPRFQWKCSFMGTVDYIVTDETGTYCATLRHSVGKYESSIANGNGVRRDMQQAIGLLVRNSHEPIPAATIDAFNEWRLADHVAAFATIDADPERYGVIAADDPLRQPPMIAKAGRYIIGQGWIAIEPGDRADAA